MGASRRSVTAAMLAFATISGAAAGVSAQDEIVPLEEGTAAPFTGMLFPTETAVRWRHRIELLEERLTLDVERAEAIGALRLRLAEDTLRIRTEQYDDDRETLREGIVRAGEPSFMDQLWDVAAPILALLAGGAIGAVIGYAVGIAAGP